MRVALEANGDQRCSGHKVQASWGLGALDPSLRFTPVLGVKNMTMSPQWPFWATVRPGCRKRRDLQAPRKPDRVAGSLGESKAPSTAPCEVGGLPPGVTIVASSHKSDMCPLEDTGSSCWFTTLLTVCLSGSPPTTPPSRSHGFGFWAGS